MPSYRRERLGESIKELLSELLMNDVKDPRVGLVTITAVAVSSDLEAAKVYFTVMGGEAERNASRKGLESARNFLRKTIGRELKLRQVPTLRFLYDDSLDRAERIEQRLKEIHDEDQSQ